jgi:hypothetical protein
VGLGHFKFGGPAFGLRPVVPFRLGLGLAGKCTG